MNKKFYVVLICIITGLTAFSMPNFLPVITNYTEKDYHAALQNWCAVQNSDGEIFFGNNHGLLRFDGYQWTLYPLPGGTIVRALLYDDDTIYAGAFENFGVFKKDKFGQYKYSSLSHDINPQLLKDEEIWFIRRVNEGIIFQSFKHIFKYDPASGRIEIIPSSIPDEEPGQELHPLFSYEINGELYSQRTIGSFYRLTPQGWKKYWDLSLYGSHIVAISLPEDYDKKESGIPDGCLIFTQDHGIYMVDNKEPKKYTTEIDDRIRDVRINRVAEASDGSIYVGTVGNGVFHINRNGKLLEHYSTLNGLNNNSVLGLLVDKNENLWICLDDGISLIHCGLPIKVLYPGYNGPYFGMGYDIGFFKNKIIAASNQGAYLFDGSFNIIPETKGQNWFVKSFGDQTFIGGNDQTIIMNEDGSFNKINISGTDIKKCEINGMEVLIQTSYYPLVYYKKSDEGDWEFGGTIEGLDTPVKQFEMDNDGTLWCSHWSTGLIKARLANDLSHLTSKTYYPNVDGDTVPQKCSVVKIRGNIYFTDDNEFYFYDDETDSFKRADKISKNLNLSGKVSRISKIDDDKFWTASPTSYDLIHYNNNYKKVYSIPLALFPRLNNGENFNIVCRDSLSYFTLNEAMGIVEMDKLGLNDKYSRLTIQRVESSDGSGIFRLLPIDGSKRVKVEGGNLVVALSFPNYDKQPYRYRFQLEGSKEQADTIVDVPMMIYPVLDWGNYNLKCSIINPAGEEIQNINYAFVVPTPPALRWWAWVIYIFAAAGIFWILSRLQSKRALKKQQLKFARDKELQEARIQEQALIIARQEKQLLESELSSKSKELASMALGAYARQQVIENMKASLAEKRKKGADTSEAEKVLKAFSGSEKDERVFWDIFEKNFDLIHEKFFRNLRLSYPSLTSSDLKFCALLRMNMSTKEISRFTNLTIRGVETARYRLRKKFGLSNDQSLVDFLMGGWELQKPKTQ